MEKDFRYKMRHIGDAFADQIGNLGHAIKGSVRGTELTYRIDALKMEKGKIVVRIGKRMAEIRKKDPTLNILEDNIMTKLFYKLDQIEDAIEAFTKEREERLYPNRFAAKQSGA